MCGIWGWYVQRPDRRLIPLESALSVAMDERGDDSAGYYAYPEGTTDGILKRELGFFSENFPARLFRGCTMLMAHSRDASIGKVNLANAHPFEVGNIIGMHNGAIYNYSDLNKSYGRDFDCDSKHVIAHLAEDIDMKDIHGYGAVAYVNKTLPTQVQLARWNGGELAVARVFLKDKQRLGVVWASTGKALAMALNAAGFEWTPVTFEEDKVQYVGPSSDGQGPDIFRDGKKKYTFGYKGNSTQFGTKFLSDTYTPKGNAANTGNDTNSHYEYCVKCGCWDLPDFHAGDNASHSAPYYGSDSRNKDFDEKRKAKQSNPKSFLTGGGETMTMHLTQCNQQHKADVLCSSHIRFAGGGLWGKEKQVTIGEITYERISIDGQFHLLAVDKEKTPDPKEDWATCESCPEGKNRKNVKDLTTYEDNTGQTYLLCQPCLKDWTSSEQESKPSTVWGVDSLDRILAEASSVRDATLGDF